MNSNLIEWRYCKGPCGELRHIDEFPICKSWYFSKKLNKTVEYAKHRYTCKTCLNAYQVEKMSQRRRLQATSYKSKDISNLGGAKANVINYLRNGSWISVIQDIGTKETERLVTDGVNDFMLVHLSTMRWLEKYHIVQEIPIPQRTTLLIEKKFVLAKEYENRQQEHSTTIESVPA